MPQKHQGLNFTVSKCDYSPSSDLIIGVRSSVGLQLLNHLHLTEGSISQSQRGKSGVDVRGFRRLGIYQHPVTQLEST